MLSLAIDYKPYHSTVPMLDRDNILQVDITKPTLDTTKPSLDNAQPTLDITKPSLDKSTAQPSLDNVQPDPKYPRSKFWFVKEGSLQKASELLGFNRGYFSSQSHRPFVRACIWVGNLSIVEGYHKLIKADEECNQTLRRLVRLLKKRREMGSFSKWAFGNEAYLSGSMRNRSTKFSFTILKRNRDLVRKIYQYLEEKDNEI